MRGYLLKINTTQAVIKDQEPRIKLSENKYVAKNPYTVDARFRMKRKQKHNFRTFEAYFNRGIEFPFA